VVTPFCRNGFALRVVVAAGAAHVPLQCVTSSPSVPGTVVMGPRTWARFQ
jgi:hypothetical protein